MDVAGIFEPLGLMKETRILQKAQKTLGHHVDLHIRMYTLAARDSARDKDVQCSPSLARKRSTMIMHLYVLSMLTRRTELRV